MESTCAKHKTQMRSGGGKGNAVVFCLNCNWSEVVSFAEAMRRIAMPDEESIEQGRLPGI